VVRGAPPCYPKVVQPWTGRGAAWRPDAYFVKWAFARPELSGGTVLEIAPVPHRSTRRERRRLALGLIVLLPVVLLVLLPAVLGLDRYVITDQSVHGKYGRGSVVLAREVPPSDLHVGDVITFDRAGNGTDQRVARRIAEIHGDSAITRTSATASNDARPVPLTSSTYSRVWLAIPWLGYPFVLDGGWVLLAMIAAAGFILVFLTGHRQPQPPGHPARPRAYAGSR
jgi:signal peptidase I